MTTLALKGENAVTRFVSNAIAYGFFSTFFFAVGDVSGASLLHLSQQNSDLNLEVKNVKLLLEHWIIGLNLTSLILFGFIVILAFELLNFSSGHLSGKSKIYMVQVPVTP
jgi:hypothetical protein